jgi:shikimate 5-dehydrogenase
MDELTEEAQAIGANTVLAKKNKLYGTNTDTGTDAIKETCMKTSLAGGTARHCF